VRLTAEEFNNWNHKSISLLGMSGVGKTRLANILRHDHWFHYSGDYRIGTRYLDEPILDNLKQQIMTVPFLRDLLRTDSIYIKNNISVDNLLPVSSFLGKLGNPDQGGLDLKSFKHRQELHKQAEISSMLDVPGFITKSREIYGYENFINDIGGSVCELDNQQVLETLAKHTLLIYIQASEENEKELIRRAKLSPKPLYYREAFLDEQLATYMKEKNIDYIAMLDPDDFVRWMFPRLFYARIPRYEKIAMKYGYTITTDQLARVSTAKDFTDLIASILSA